MVATSIFAKFMKTFSTFVILLLDIGYVLIENYLNQCQWLQLL